MISVDTNVLARYIMRDDKAQWRQASELLETDAVMVEAHERLRAASEWRIDRFDFADALHLASSHACESLATFDQGFIKAEQVHPTSISVFSP